jgi:hypothetical protein
MQPAQHLPREHARIRRQSMSEFRLRTLLILMNRALSQERSETYLRHRNQPIEALTSYCPITRSQIEFALGLATGDRNTSTRCAMFFADAQQRH